MGVERRWAGGGAWVARCLLAEGAGGGASHLACHSNATAGRVRPQEHGSQVRGHCEDSAHRALTPSEGFLGAVPGILATQVSERHTRFRGLGVEAREDRAERAAATSWTR